MYKEQERALYLASAPLSITKAVKQINKMYGIKIPITENQTQMIYLKNNEVQQKILEAVLAIC